MTRLKTIEQVEAEARRLGVTYGQLTAPLVYVRGYAGKLADFDLYAETDETEKKVLYCAVCGKKLHGRQQKFCGEQCRVKFFAGPYQKREIAEELRLCPECGKPIDDRRRKFCSVECGYRFRQKKYTEKKKSAPPDASPK